MASMKAKQLTQANVIVPAGVHLLDLQIPNDSVIWHLETDQFNHPKSSKRTICSTRTLTGLQCLLTFSQTSEISLYGPGRGCPRVRQRYHSWEIHSFWFVITSDYWLIHRGHQQLGLYLGDPWGVFNSSHIQWSIHILDPLDSLDFVHKTYTTTSPAFPLHFPSWKRTCSMWSKEKGTTKLSLSFGP